MRPILVLSAVVLFLTGCATTVSETSAPKDTRAADEQAVRDRETAGMAAWKAKDADQIAALYADDATVMIPNAPVMKGRQAIHDGLKQAVADPNFSLQTETTSVEAAKSGDLAYVKGTYNVNMSDAKTKKPMTENGSYVMVYKKQPDASWKVVADIATPGPPPAGK